MTNITLHGILAKEFGENFKMQIYKAANVIKAIDVNRKNFNKRIFELSREGLNYTMIVDGKKITELEELNIQREPQEIHLVPLIVGAGAVLGAAILTGIGSVLTGVGATGAGAFFATLAGNALAAGIVGSLALTAVSIGLQMLLAPKPEAPAPISASTKAMSESFSFSNKVNIASQGVAVPVGYGRLKVASQVIQFSIKSYPQNQESVNAMQQAYYSNTSTTDPIPAPQSVSNKTS
jgi:predicted phage tail protein